MRQRNVICESERCSLRVNLLELFEQVVAGLVLRGAGRAIGPQKLALRQRVRDQENQRGTGAIIELRGMNANPRSGRGARQTQQVGESFRPRPGPALDRWPAAADQLGACTVIPTQTPFRYHVKAIGQGLLEHFPPRGPGHERLATVAVEQMEG